MKNSWIISTFLIPFFCLQASCCKDDIEKPVSLGEIKVDLDASKSAVRTKETLIGNMISDAMKESALQKGKQVDFAVINGGGIRFNQETRPSGIYPAGSFTSSMVDEMLPFGNTSSIVKITGRELKSIFERSVAQLPLAQGPFLQLSKEIKIVVDTTKESQIINELADPNFIVRNGKRIISIKINNVEYDSLATYSVVMPDFTALGNDGNITLKYISADKKEFLNEDLTGAVKEYIILHTPVIPVIEGRIVFQ
jgi:2',3'-cyclic-nucleotide 2'-phosphodiesterase (5'-nucleotidase family)